MRCRGIVVALALVFFGATYAQPVYQTVWLLVFAYVVLFFPAGVGRNTRGHAASQSPAGRGGPAVSDVIPSRSCRPSPCH